MKSLRLISFIINGDNNYILSNIINNNHVNCGSYVNKIVSKKMTLYY